MTGEWWFKEIMVDGKQVLARRSVDERGGYKFKLTVCAVDFLPGSKEGEVSVEIIKSREALTVSEFGEFTEEANIRKMIAECIRPLLKHCAEMEG